MGEGLLLIWDRWNKHPLVVQSSAYQAIEETWLADEKWFYLPFPILEPLPVPRLSPILQSERLVLI